MTNYTILLCLLAIAIEIALAVAIAPVWAPQGVEPLYVLFLAGPLLFLALVAWRRRGHPSRPGFLFRFALFVAVPGVAVLLFDYIRFRTEEAGQHAAHMHPLIIPLAQWVMVLAIWIGLAILEGQEKRESRAAAKKA